MSSSFFLDDNTALTFPAIPKLDWTRRGEGGGSQRSTPSFHCPPRSLERAGLAHHTGTGPFLQTTRSEANRQPPSAPSRNSPQTFPSDLQSHASQDPLPSWRAVWSHVESNGSFSLLMIVKNTAQHISMQQPPVCSTSALYSWLTIHRSSP